MRQPLRASISLANNLPSIGRRWPLQASHSRSSRRPKADVIDSHTFADHWARAKQANLLRGAYHFFRPKQDAAAQARFFLAQLADPGELPPVLDEEVVNGIPLAQIAASVGAWLDIVTASVGRTIVYTSPSFWNALPGVSEIASKADLWVANWGARSLLLQVHGWSKWTFWQFTNKATYRGHPRHRGHGRGPVQRIVGGAAFIQRCLRSRHEVHSRTPTTGSLRAPKREPAFAEFILERGLPSGLGITRFLGVCMSSTTT